MARYTVTLRADKARYPVLLSNGNLVEQGDARRRPPLRDVARPVSRSRATCSRWSRATSPRSTTRSRHAHRAATVALQDLRRRRRTCEMPARDGRRSSASMRWDEERFGREYDLDAFMIVAPTTSTWARWRTRASTSSTAGTCWPTPRPRPTTTSRGDRGRGRPRVLPQLDRQPRHLPRLVPAVAEGRPHGLPRPGVLERPGLARASSASTRSRTCAASSSPRTPARWRTRCGPDEYLEINNFYTATVYEKGAEVVRMLHTLLGRERLPPRHGPVLRAPRRPGRDLRRLRAGDAGRLRRRPRAVQALVLPGRHAGRRGARRATTRRRAPTRSTSRRRTPPTPGSRAEAAAAHPARRRADRTRRPRPAAAARRRAHRAAPRHACSS